MRPILPAVTFLLVCVAATGCGGDDKPAAKPTPSPTVSVDGFAKKMCDTLAKQDPGNPFANDLAVTIAQQSTMPELVDLAAKAKAAGSSNLLRAWCVKNVPSAGVAVPQPASS